ncbi:hypothetical protein K9848_09575 [Latilactobacillus sakei]|uniref:zinc-ribbon domain-containing protein n=1 Tax=Latilactobacillus sakei TaxID=1599 RepID=UPI0020C7BEC7|nr:zinc-ribbon domain-containing protein [Latilactobacillus sakei]MCP8856438.1 hypothetical protein [Latilactobacillus sakei]
MSEESIFCPECGTRNPITNGFCESCGTKLEGAKPLDPKQVAYDKAITDFSEGRFEAAITAFKLLDDYQDSREKITLVEKAQAEFQAQQQTNDYDQAIASFGQGDLETAEMLFTRLGDYRDAPQKLQLIQEAKAQQHEQDYDAAYQSGIAAAEAAETVIDLQQAMQYLEQFGSYKETQIKLREYQNKQQILQANEAAQNQVTQKKNKMIMSVVAVIVLIAAGAGWYVYSQQQAANQLAEKVTEQRASNVKSLDKLDSKTQKNLRTIAKTYNANAEDYTYKVMGQTDDYLLVGYNFKGPDKTKDMLPTSGTHNYKELAFYRVD